MQQTLEFDLAIIGAGSAGLSLAAGAAQLGLKVALIEQHKMGGDCLNYGCIPSKALLAAAKSIYQARKVAQGFGAELDFKGVDFSKVINHVKSTIKTIEPHDSKERFESLGVRVIMATAYFVNAKTIQAGEHLITAKKIVIASGSSPFIPPIPGIQDIPYLTNETIFNLEELPKKLVVIGGGPIGCELAQAFAMLGSQVTIIEAQKVLPKDDPECTTVVKKSLEAMGIQILEKTNISAITAKEHIEIKLNAGEDHISASHVLVATGRKPNIEKLKLDIAKIDYTPKGITTNQRLQTNQKHIYAIGDATGPYQFTHMASYQAGIALKNIVFKLPSKVSYSAVPWVTYTYPELAHVGADTHDSSPDKNQVVTKWLYQQSDRAQTEKDTQGLIKVITNKRGKILGASIVGAHAGELILPWVMAIQQGNTLRTFTDTIAPYPTLSEISKQVSGEFYKPKLFSNTVRRVVAWIHKIF